MKFLVMWSVLSNKKGPFIIIISLQTIQDYNRSSQLIQEMLNGKKTFKKPWGTYRNMQVSSKV